MNRVTRHIFNRMGSVCRRGLPALLFLCPLFCWMSPLRRVTGSEDFWVVSGLERIINHEITSTPSRVVTLIGLSLHQNGLERHNATEHVSLWNQQPGCECAQRRQLTSDHIQAKIFHALHPANQVVVVVVVVEVAEATE